MDIFFLPMMSALQKFHFINVKYDGMWHKSNTKYLQINLLFVSLKYISANFDSIHWNNICRLIGILLDNNWMLERIIWNLS